MSICSSSDECHRIERWAIHVQAACLALRFGIQGSCLVGLDPNDREQHHSSVTDFAKQSMQRGLIDHRTGQERLAVGFQRERHAPKSVRPLRPQMPRDPDVIDHRFL